MKLHFLDRSNLQSNSFSIKHDCYANFIKIWHYHPEIELVHILKSTGTRFIGDSIQQFKEGEVILIGENLPHMWLNEESYFKVDSEMKAEAISIYFNRNFMGPEFLNAPEMIHIDRLLEESRYGIKFYGLEQGTKNKITDLISHEGFERLVQFLKILNDLAKHDNTKRIASKGFLSTFTKTGNRRLDKTYAYIFKNFTKTISLDEIAEVANMNPSAFSRFFKRMNRKGFKEYVNEIRIGYACKLLTEHELNITTICYESGFNNISNFNRQFKKITGKSPSAYLKHHTNIPE